MELSLNKITYTTYYLIHSRSSVSLFSPFLLLTSEHGKRETVHFRILLTLLLDWNQVYIKLLQGRELVSIEPGPILLGTG